MTKTRGAVQANGFDSGVRVCICLMSRLDIPTEPACDRLHTHRPQKCRASSRPRCRRRVLTVACTGQVTNFFAHSSSPWSLEPSAEPKSSSQPPSPLPYRLICPAPEAGTSNGTSLNCRPGATKGPKLKQKPTDKPNRTRRAQ